MATVTYHKRAKRFLRLKNAKEEALRADLIAFCVYMIFVIIATIVIGSVYHLYMFYYNYLIRELFVDNMIETRWSEEVKFADVIDETNFYDYIREIFLPRLHGKTKFAQQTLLKRNVFLGPPRLRQMRVHKTKCVYKDLFDKYLKDCYPEYTALNEDKRHEYKRTTYFTKSQLSTTNIDGVLAYYSGGGYIQSLTYNYTQNFEIFKHFEKIKWLDRATRIFIIEFVLYNDNARMFENVKLIAECSPLGEILMSAQIQSLKCPLFMEEDIFLYVVAVLFYLMTALYTFYEIVELNNKGWNDYICSKWKFADIAVLFMIYLSLIYNIVNHVTMKELLNEVRHGPKDFISIDTICYWNHLYMDMMGICIFLIWVRIFKYLGFTRTVLHITITINRVTADLLGFFLMFLIIFIAYAQLGLLIFGAYHPDFYTFDVTLMTLMRILLGDFEYKALQNISFVFGPIYIVTYTVIVMFILLNVFLVILNEMYIIVKSRIKEEQIDICAYILYSLRKCCARCCGRRDTFKDEMKIDPETGFPIDPLTGIPFDPKTGLPIDPTILRSPIRLRGIFKEYYKEIPKPPAEKIKDAQEDVEMQALEDEEEEEEDNKNDEKDFLLPEVLDYNYELRRLTQRAIFLEHELDMLLDKMDAILRTMGKTKRR